jgi:hypothetical protein
VIALLSLASKTVPVTSWFEGERWIVTRKMKSLITGPTEKHHALLKNKNKNVLVKIVNLITQQIIDMQ